MGLAYYTSIGFAAVVATISLPGPDVLHFRYTGAYQMARLVSQGVKDINIPISQFVIQAKLDGGWDCRGRCRDDRRRRAGHRVRR
jgi:hypothetical protein